MLTDQSTLQLTLDVVGIFAFALSGGVVAVRAGLDLFGVLVPAGVAGLGGGILRDVLLGATPPPGIHDPVYLGTILVAALVTFWFHPRVEQAKRVVDVLDATGLAAFTATGVLKAFSLGAPPMAAVVVGTVTAVGGGMIRDLLADRVPEVLRGQYYATPSLAGGAVMALLHWAHLLNGVTVWGVVLAVFAVRVLVIRHDVHAPLPRTDLTDPAPERSPS